MGHMGAAAYRLHLLGAPDEARQRAGANRKHWSAAPLPARGRALRAAPCSPSSAMAGGWWLGLAMTACRASAAVRRPSWAQPCADQPPRLAPRREEGAPLPREAGKKRVSGGGSRERARARLQPEAAARCLTCGRGGCSALHASRRPRSCAKEPRLLTDACQDQALREGLPVVLNSRTGAAEPVKNRGTVPPYAIRDGPSSSPLITSAAA